MLYGNHITPRRSLKSGFRLLPTDDLAADAQLRLMSTESSVGMLCGNHLINSYVSSRYPARNDATSMVEHNGSAASGAESMPNEELRSATNLK